MPTVGLRSRNLTLRELGLLLRLTKYQMADSDTVPRCSALSVITSPARFRFIYVTFCQHRNTCVHSGRNANLICVRAIYQCCQERQQLVRHDTAQDVRAFSGQHRVGGGTDRASSRQRHRVNCRRRQRQTDAEPVDSVFGSIMRQNWDPHIYIVTVRA